MEHAALSSIQDLATIHHQAWILPTAATNNQFSMQRSGSSIGPSRAGIVAWAILTCQGNQSPIRDESHAKTPRPVIGVIPLRALVREQVESNMRQGPCRNVALPISQSFAEQHVFCGCESPAQHGPGRCKTVRQNAYYRIQEADRQHTCWICLCQTRPENEAKTLEMPHTSLSQPEFNTFHL